MPQPPVYVFVYGTLRLRNDFPMHGLLLPAEFIGYGTLRGELYDVGSYPAAVLTDASDRLVRGEVYLLRDPAATFERLDAYEGCAPDRPQPHEYLRTVVPIVLETGERLLAHAYLYNYSVERLTRVESGDYLLWRSPRAGRVTAP